MSKFKNKYLLGGVLGAGKKFEKKSLALRYDINFRMQQIYYNIKYIEQYTNPMDMLLFIDRDIKYNQKIGKKYFLSYGAAFTVNTKKLFSHVNCFINAEYNFYKYFGFNFLTESYYSSFVSLTPGIYIDFNNNYRFLCGYKISREFIFDDITKSNFKELLLQMDFKL